MRSHYQPDILRRYFGAIIIDLKNVVWRNGFSSQCAENKSTIKDRARCQVSQTPHFEDGARRRDAPEPQFDRDNYYAHQ